MSRPVRINKEELRDEFINSTCTLRELASRTGASYSLVTKLASSERWADKRQEQRLQFARTRERGLPESTCTAQQHVNRSLLAGDQIHQLLNEASAAIRAGDIRSLKTLVDAWANWDNQMRKNHRLGEEQSQQLPIVNVQLMASLPNEPSYSITPPPLFGVGG